MSQKVRTNTKASKWSRQAPAPTTEAPASTPNASEAPRRQRPNNFIIYRSKKAKENRKRRRPITQPMLSKVVSVRWKKMSRARKDYYTRKSSQKLAGHPVEDSDDSGLEDEVPGIPMQQLPEPADVQLLQPRGERSLTTSLAVREGSYSSVASSPTSYHVQESPSLQSFADSSSASSSDWSDSFHHLLPVSGPSNFGTFLRPDGGNIQEVPCLPSANPRSALLSYRSVEDIRSQDVSHSHSHYHSHHSVDHSRSTIAHSTLSRGALPPMVPNNREAIPAIAGPSRPYYDYHNAVDTQQVPTSHVHAAQVLYQYEDMPQGGMYRIEEGVFGQPHNVLGNQVYHDHDFVSSFDFSGTDTSAFVPEDEHAFDGIWNSYYGGERSDAQSSAW